MSKKLKDATTELCRNSSFKNEAIRKAIIVEDIIRSQEYVTQDHKPKMIYSAFFPDRDMSEPTHKQGGWMDYTWHV